MKLAGAIILYNPEKLLIGNILSYLEDLDKLYIFDNSTISNIEFPESIKAKIKYIHSGDNKGIAVRLNEAIFFARSEGFEYLLTMDQDSSFNSGDLANYKSIVKQHPQINEIAMFGVAHDILMQKNTILDNGNNKLITSGSIINLSIIPDQLLFDEQLFIDSVDIEFCFNAWSHHLKTILINKILLNHSIGEVRLVTTPLFHKKKRMIHSPSRLYYIVRNFFYVRKKHPKYRYAYSFSIIYNEIKNGLLYGAMPLEYLKEITLGIFDAFNGKMGAKN